MFGVFAHQGTGRFMAGGRASSCSRGPCYIPTIVDIDQNRANSRSLIWKSRNKDEGFSLVRGPKGQRLRYWS